MYGGAYAVRAWALVQALKSGIVDELLRWSRTGIPGGFDELARRLSSRSGVPMPVAEWALAEWLSQLRRDLVPAEAPAAAPASDRAVTREPGQPATIALGATDGPDVLVRIPHLVLAGLALAGAMAVGALVWRPGALAVGVLGEASATTPSLPKAPAIDEHSSRGRAAACASTRDDGPDRPPRAAGGGTLPMPADAREAGLDDGWATVRIGVGSDGRVDRDAIEVVDASHPAIASSVADVVAALRYRPARRDGCAVGAIVTRTVRFSSDGAPPR